MRTSWLVVLAACGRVGFDGHTAPADAACSVGAACTPIAACRAGACNAAGACVAGEPITGACPGGTCGGDGVCDGAAPNRLPIAAGASSGFGMGLEWQNDRLVVGSPIEGTAVVIERVGGVWTSVAPLASSNAGPNHNFGLAVALDGDRALVGAPGVNAVDVFERQPDGTWSNVGSLPNAGGSDFGTSVDLQGDRAIVGAESSDTAYIFDRDASGAWNLSAMLGTMSGLDFGKHVILDGDHAFVSTTWEANTDGRECGSVRVFERGATGTWTQIQLLQPPVSEAVDAFGIGMAVDGDVLVVGGPWAYRDKPSAGVVIVYRRDAAGTWQFEAALHEAAEVQSGELGRGVWVHGDRIFATMVRDFDGLLAVFRRQPDGQWLETARLVDPEGNQAGYGTGGIESDLQIQAIGDTALVGAPLRDGTGGIVAYDVTAL